MNITFRRLPGAPTIAGVVVLGLFGAAALGCRSGGATYMPLPPIEREVDSEGREVLVLPSPDAAAAPKSWTRKFADFCTPKPPPKSASNRVYESDSVPYSD